MLETVVWPAMLARLCRLGLALSGFGLWTTDSGAAEAGRAARMANFVRPKNVPFPPEDPLTPEKAELGRMLFFDPLLSRSGTISCATCHPPRLAWGDGRGGVARPSRDEHIHPPGLSASKRDDLIAFLQTLTAAEAWDPSPVIPAR